MCSVMWPGVLQMVEDVCCSPAGTALQPAAGGVVLLRGILGEL